MPRSPAIVIFLVACAPGNPGTDTTDDKTTADATTVDDPTTGAAVTDASGGSEIGTTTDVDSDTTGGSTTPDPFPQCTPPGDAAAYFTITAATLDLGELQDLDCTVSSVANGAKTVIDLVCTDAMAVAHDVQLEFSLSHGDVVLLPGSTAVRLLYSEGLGIDTGNEHYLALRGVDDSLLVFVAQSYDVFASDLSDFWAPFTLAIESDLCPAPGCPSEERVAVVAGFGGDDTRVLDRQWSDIAATMYEIHVGAATIVSGSDECEAPADGRYGRMILFLNGA